MIETSATVLTVYTAQKHSGPRETVETIYSYLRTSANPRLKLGKTETLTCRRRIANVHTFTALPSLYTGGDASVNKQSSSCVFLSNHYTLRREMD
jgi:hypothetical protein